ncbi:amino acid adenylation domain-containing protein [Laceyella tengchongensis]|nr:amino acid adenylation domain-containing protein [Laceyella tengchongensis]
MQAGVESPSNKKHITAVGVRVREGTPAAEFIYATAQVIWMDKKNMADIYSLSPMQEAMLFHSLYDQGNSYFLQMVMKTEGDLDPALLEKSMNVLIQRYEVFRTVFVYKGMTKPRQVVLKERKFKIGVRDLSHLPESERTSAFSQLLRQDQETPFDLTKDILWRVTVVHMGEGHHHIIFSSHHILTDGWCMGIILEDLFETYGRLRQGHPIPTKRVTPYREYIRWLEKQDKEQALTYWKDYLAGFDERTGLPRQGQENPQDYRLEKASYQLDPALAEGLHQLARTSHVTLNNLFQTIWGILLQKYNDTEDALFGAVVSGRNKEIHDIENIVGLFINTVPVRVKGVGSQRFIELAKEVHQASLDKEAFDYLSLAEVQERTELKEQLFDHIMVFENYDFDRSVFEKHREHIGFDICGANSTFDKTNYDFNVIVVPGEKCQILFHYNGLSYTASFVDQVFRHFSHIAKQVVERPDLPIAEIEVVTEEEKRTLLVDFNPPTRPYPKHKPVQQLFEEQVERTPDHVALKMGTRQLTYRELNTVVNRLARVLRRRGVVRGQLVGLMAERSLEMIIGMFAIIKAGAAYVPIDPNYPEERIQFMLDDGHISLIVKQPHLCLPPTFMGDIVILDEKVWAGEEGDNLPLMSGPEDMIYVIYTSGSTGTPKGSISCHYNVVRTIVQTGDVDITAEDAMLQLANFTFDGSVFDIFGALLHGAKLVLAPKEVLLDLNQITALIREEKITICFMTTALFNTIVDLNVSALADLRKLIFGGEKASLKHVRKALAVLGNDRLVNAYGPTEGTVYATMYRCEPYWLERQTVPIGKPVNATKLYVVNKSNQLQPIGVPGELCVSGDGVALGYLNRPELTAERFVPDPFEPGRTMYRTGDLVRWLPDGNIEYIDRMDGQVKIRGHRIELGEIEVKLFEHPAVEKVVVIADKDEHGHSYLCAYVMLGQPCEMSELRQHVQAGLPEYMVPDYFVEIADLPLTFNGKIDKRSLPKPTHSLRTEADYVRPANELEASLAEIFQEVLNLEQVSVTANFFQLGGHSLKAMILASQVHKRLRVDLPLQEVFARPTVRDLASYVQASRESKQLVIKPAPAQEWYPASSQQKRLYVVNQLEGSGISYNMPMAFDLQGRFEVERLERAFGQLIARHESLRTSFHLVEGELKQKVHQDVSFAIQKMTAESEKEMQDQLCAFVRPFALDQAPLFRVGLISLAPERAVLVMDLHHMIADGVSMNLLFQDLVRLYEGERLPPLSLQYKDIAVWQQSDAVRAEWKRHEAFWLQEMAGELPVLALPTDFPRPPVQQFDGAYTTFALDDELTRKLKRLMEEQNVTLYMLLLAAYHVLLAKYTGQEDIIIGSPIAGRSHADMQPVVGMFVNTLAVRNTHQPEQTFAEFLAQVKARVLKMMQHQDYPFEELVEKLGLARDLSRNPLFDTLFAVQNMDLSALVLPGLTWTPLEMEWKQAKFDMSWVVAEGEQVQGTVEYSTHLFTEATVQRMIGHFIHIIEQIVERPQMRLRDIGLVTEAEKEVLLGTFNETAQPYPKDKPIHQLFVEQASRTPEHAAVVCQGQSLTYRELDRRSNELAQLLRDRGVQREQIIGLMLPPSLDLFVAMLGVLKAGAAFLPIDPEYPAERIKYMLEDSRVPFTLTHAEIKERVKDAPVLTLDELQLSGKEVPSVPLVNKATDLAYVIYTSGSTGKPKGVMVEHRSLVNLACWHVREFGLTERDRSTKYAGLGFDASVWEIFPNLIAGATIHVIEESLRHDVIGLNRYMNENGITISFLPTPVAEQFMRLENRSLRTLLVGGDRLQQVEPRPYVVVNNYGPTENTVVTTSGPVKPGEAITIGKPVANNRVYVINRDGQLQPIGVPGELCVSGESLARGYLHRPDLTAEKFVDNPFAAGEKVYKTGDLARWTADGQIEFVGRVDEQVKIRGYRIEPGEVTARLLQHPAIREAVVLAREGNDGERRLCAYFTLEEAFDIAELRAHLAQELPDYMIPSHWVPLEQMPLTANGKVDKKALPEPSGDSEAEAYTPPVTPTEQKLAAIWQELLQVKRVSRTDSFFALGGHSLKAMALTSRLQEEWGVDLSLRELFAHPTVKELAEFIHGRAHEKEAIPVAPMQEYYPVTSTQKRLYVVSQLEGVGTGYNMPLAFRLHGELQEERLQRACQQLIERHESLRTSFHLVGGALKQKVHAHVPLSIEWMEAQDVAEAEAELRRFVRPFALDEAPLFRVGLIRLKADQHVLVLDLHHIVGDGVSVNILIRDLMRLYQGETLPAHTVQFKDIAVWQESESAQAARRRHEAFWLEMFAGDLPVLELPTDRPRPPVQRFEGQRFGFRLDADTTENLRKVASQTGATLYMVLLAAYHVLLNKYTGQDDFVVGTPLAGRTHAEMEPIVGMFANTLAVRNQVREDQSFRQLVDHVKERVLDVMEHQSYPMEDLLEKLGLRRDMSRNPLFDTVFAVQNLETPHLSLPDLEVHPFEWGWQKAKFDLSWVIAEGEELEGSVEYSTYLFSEATIRRMTQHFTHILEQVAKKPELLISQVELMTVTEKTQVLYEFNRTEAPYPHQRTVTQLFAERVSLVPDRTAVIHGQKRITYRELNRRANLVAGALHRMGVARGQIVGLLTKPSIEMIIGIWGILKAGAAYLPIDPQYPEERIRYMVADSRAEIVLTHGDVPALASVRQLDLGAFDYGGGAGEELALSHNPHDLAYVIYTSGSTGKPKGVMVEHKALVNLVTWHNRRFHVTEEDRMTKYAGVGFDASVWEIFPTLVAGAALIIIDEELRYEIEALNRYMEQQGVTISFLPTQVAEQFMQLPNRTLKTLLVGGDRLQRMVPQTYAVINNYGPTENTVVTTSCELKADQPILIGKPIDNHRVYVLNKHHQLQPIGVPGELCVSGVGLARGYLHLPELTAEKFVESPFDLGERLYKTGDLVKWLPDGSLEFLGRIDDQVKIRGYRIELGEISTRLLQHEAVKEAVALTQTMPDGRQELCVYYTTSDDCSIEDLRAHLARELPDYMVPKHFVELADLPLTANGKVDKRALPTPETGSALREYVPPRTPVERVMAEVWQEVLHLERVGVHDPFFELGGDSIKAMQVAARLAQHRLKMRLKDLFQHPTIAELAPALRTLETESEQDLVVGEVPLTPIQHWIFDMNETVDHWNMAIILKRKEGWKTTALRKAFIKITEHHDALRMVCRREGGRIRLFNRGRDGVHFTLEEFNLAGEANIAKRIEQEANRLHRSIKLAEGPLVKLAVFHADDGDYLLLSIHHLVIDAVSWRIISEDLDSAYEQALSGKEIVLPAKTTSFKEWSHQLSRYANSADFLKERAYWERMAAERVPKLPIDKRGVETYLFQDLHTITMRLPAEETKELFTHAHRAYQTEVNDLLLAALAQTVSEWVGGKVAVDLEGHGREEIIDGVDLTRTVGWFTSIYPVILEADQRDLRRTIRNVKEALRQVPHKGVGYGIMKYLTDPALKQALRLPPRAEINFNYQGEFVRDMEKEEYRLSDMPVGQGINPLTKWPYKMDFNIFVENGELLILIRYQSTLFYRETMERFAANYKGNLERIIDHCRSKVLIK